MSEYIIRLNLTVKVCKLYDELVSLVLADNEFNDEFNEKVLEIKKILKEENNAYERLNEYSVNKYIKQLSDDNVLELDSVKSRYYNKLKERLSILDGSNDSGYPFSLETAIVGKILLDSIKKIESDILNKKNMDDENSIYDLLYSFHNAYKYNLISTNAFLEELAVDFNFNIMNIPSISFERIKDNFLCNNRFYKYLDNLLLLISKDIVKILCNDCADNDITVIYFNLLSIVQLEIITLHLSLSSLDSLCNYLNMLNIDLSVNGKYVKRLVLGKINGDVNDKFIKR